MNRRDVSGAHITLESIGDEAESVATNVTFTPHTNFNANFDSVYTQFIELVGDARVTSFSDISEVVPLIMDTIRFVERVAKRYGDTGESKRELAMACLVRLFNDSPHLSVDTKQRVVVLIELLAPSIIDALIYADHGKLFREGVRRFNVLCCRRQ